MEEKEVNEHLIYLLIPLFFLLVLSVFGVLPEIQERLEWISGRTLNYFRQFP